MIVCDALGTSCGNNRPIDLPLNSKSFFFLNSKVLFIKENPFQRNQVMKFLRKQFRK